METLYRKEQILNIVDRCFHMYASDYRNDARIFATEMLEEIPDHTAQPKADKAELLEALEKVRDYHYNGYFIDSEFNEEIESLIQKHKPCDVK